MILRRWTEKILKKKPVCRTWESNPKSCPVDRLRSPYQWGCLLVLKSFNIYKSIRYLSNLSHTYIISFNLKTYYFNIMPWEPIEGHAWHTNCIGDTYKIILFVNLFDLYLSDLINTYTIPKYQVNNLFNILLLRHDREIAWEILTKWFLFVYFEPLLTPQHKS